MFRTIKQVFSKLIEAYPKDEKSNNDMHDRLEIIMLIITIHFKVVVN